MNPPATLRHLILAAGTFLAAQLPAHSATFTLHEAGIAELTAAMDAGVISSAELTALYVNRYLAYDRHGPRLNAIPVFNPAVFTEAAAADAARARGQFAPLLGVPYTVKDSYKVQGLTVASGSPAFASLVANEDAFVVGRLRAAGAIVLGKTNMPPMAAGGMQPGVYGRAESPYNPLYLASARSSGSSNGAGVATTVNLGAFGMGEETVSSGRAPTSYNSLVGYTPSRGVLSIRGNWPLFADRDVVVPMTRSMGDLLHVLDVIMVTDPVRTGDLWLEQTVVKIPAPESIRPASLLKLAPASLKGRRFAAPTSFIGKDPTSNFFNYQLRPSVAALWEKTVADLRAAGAEVVEVELPLIANYFEDRPGVKTFVERGIMPAAWWNSTDRSKQLDSTHLWNIYLEQFLQACKDPRFPSFAAVDATLIFPAPPGSVEEKRNGPYSKSWITRRETIVKGLPPAAELPDYAAYLQGLETIRKLEFEDWLKANRFDAVIFPAVADLGKADLDYNEASYVHSISPGVGRGQTERMMRHLGIPSITLPMGILTDIGMPVGVTLMGPAYADIDLLKLGLSIEATAKRRQPPALAIPLADETITYDPATVLPPSRRSETAPPLISIDPVRLANGNAVGVEYTLRGQVTDASALRDVRVYVNGHKTRVQFTATTWTARLTGEDWLRWGATHSATVVVVAVDAHGNAGVAHTLLPSL